MPFKAHLPKGGCEMDCTFASDNTSGVHPKVMEALNKANVGAAEPYGDDPWTAEAEGCFKGAVRR